jgi:hypothetical protein
MERTRRQREFAAVKPEVVARSMAEFSKPGYRVDVLKVGVPVNMAFVEGSPAAGKEILYSREGVMDYYRRATEEARVPFIVVAGSEQRDVPICAGTGRRSRVNFFRSALRTVHVERRRCNFCRTPNGTGRLAA